MSSLNSGLQLALPNWVRARGLAYYLVVFQGAQALAAVVWGTVADRTSVTMALLAAAAVLAVGAVVGLRSPMPDTSEAGPDPVGALAGPAADVHAGRRRRTGAGHADLRVPERERRGVHRGDAATSAGPGGAPEPCAGSCSATAATPTRFVESYLVGTWAEHLRQHENRLTGADRRFEEQANRYALGEPQVAHLFPPPAPEATKR